MSTVYQQHLKEEALDSLSLVVQNNFVNAFNIAWKAAEKAGDVSEADDFVKPFVKKTAKEMLKYAWTKSPLRLYAEAVAGSKEEIEGFRTLVYARVADTASFSLSYGLEEGKLNEIVKSKCCDEVLKLYLKSLETHISE